MLTDAGSHHAGDLERIQGKAAWHILQFYSTFVNIANDD